MAPSDTVKVFARLRPSNPEADGLEDVEGGGGGGTFLTPAALEDSDGCFQAFDCTSGELVYQKPGDGGDGMTFRFDGLFGAGATQGEVYQGAARTIVDGVLQGYNGAILAYGQTGSGKTFSMRGPEASTAPESEIGTIPRALSHLLEERERLSKEENVEISLCVSYLQIYCEILQDLLAPASTNLSVREATDGRVYVQGLSRVPVHSINQCMEILREGDNHRTVASTNLNAASSRSHAAVIVHLERREPTVGGERGMLVTSTLTMVDLAGSERVKRSGVQYQKLEESKAINLSLSSLGNCVSALAHERSHIPYRDSKLTRLLSQSLGGNARTAILVTLSPGNDLTSENLSTLRFAQRASRVKVSAVRNETVDYATLYQKAQAEVDRKDDSIHALELEVAKLKSQLTECKAERDAAVDTKTAAEAKFQSAEAGYAASLNALQQTSGEDADGSRAVAAIESVNEKWRSEIDTLQKQHEAQLAELRQRMEKQIHAYKSAAAEASQEHAVAEGELTHEREGYLETLTKYRECREQLQQSEKESAARISELLVEKADYEAKEAELVEALESARKTADISLGKASDMAERVESLESVHREQASQISRDYVSREHVEAMERLFKETVERLTNRLEQLEENVPDRQRGRGSEGTRKILSSIEDPRAAAGGAGGGIRRGVRVEPGGGGAARGIRIEPGRLRAGGGGRGAVAADRRRNF